MLVLNAGLHPEPYAEQAPLCPSAQSAWIGRARGILAVRCSLLHRVAGTDPLTGLLSAPQAVVPERCQPIRQDRVGLLAWVTDSAPHPDALLPVIVGLAKSPSVPDDRVAMTNRTTPGQKLQRDYPGSALSFAAGSAIKRITAGVKARR